MIDSISEEVLKLIPKKKVLEWNIIPLRFENEVLHIAINNKFDKRIIDEVSFFTGLQVKVVEYPIEIIHEKLAKIFPSNDNSISGSELNKDFFAGESTNIDFVNSIIYSAIKASASDIHFESYEKVFRIRIRVDGHLREVSVLAKEKGIVVISRLKIMADLDISERRRPQDGKINFPYLNSFIDIRLSSLPTSFGEKVVLRILNRNLVELNFDKLGLNKKQLDLLKSKINIPYGMILVTGPTGSGKTTTLYTALKHLHSVEKNILTIEDPIEYNLEGINQSQIKPDIGYDFANALRAFLRQDPDIIMVGEIRDQETAEIAIRASLTGHLVFSTLHTNDSASAITRLIDMGIEPFLISSSIKLIIAQRLVRKLCSCKTVITSSDSKNNTFVPAGCEICSYTGYKGRTAIYELLEMNEEICTKINKNITVLEIKKIANKSDQQTLNDSGNEKVLEGITSHQEVIRETCN